MESCPRSPLLGRSLLSELLVGKTELDAEEEVLGALLTSKAAFPRLIKVGLRPEDFYGSANRILFKLITDEAVQGRDFDEITIADAAERAGVIDEVGGRNAISLKAATVEAPGNIAEHARIVRENGKRRRMVEAGYRIITAASDKSKDLEAVQAGAVEELFPEQPGGVRKIGEVLSEAVETIQSGGIKVVPTGYPKLDRVIRGLIPGGLTLLGASTSQGKSVMALEIAKKAAMADQSVLFLSLEMSEQELAMRMISSESKVPLYSILNGRIPDKKWNQIIEACNRIDNLEFWVEYRAGTDLLYTESVARSLQAASGLDLVVVDYLQLMDGQGINEYERVSRVSTGLKKVAGRLGIPVLAVSQLSRAPESRPDKTPRLSDLRSSGQLEQDADQVLLLHSPESEEDGEEPDLKVIVAKNRNGPLGEVEFQFQRSTTSIS
jgi:replicative DNA helicase